jgi:hypothetical protein
MLRAQYETADRKKKPHIPSSTPLSPLEVLITPPPPGTHVSPLKTQRLAAFPHKEGTLERRRANPRPEQDAGPSCWSLRNNGAFPSCVGIILFGEVRIS